MSSTNTSANSGSYSSAPIAIARHSQSSAPTRRGFLLTLGLAHHAEAVPTVVRFGIARNQVTSSDLGLLEPAGLHKLATNAAKYGALSNKDGHVWVCWRQQQDGQGEKQLRIEWQERGGPRWTHSLGAATAPV